MPTTEGSAGSPSDAVSTTVPASGGGVVPATSASNCAAVRDGSDGAAAAAATMDPASSPPATATIPAGTAHLALRGKFARLLHDTSPVLSLPWVTCSRSHAPRSRSQSADAASRPLYAVAGLSTVPAADTCLAPAAGGHGVRRCLRREQCAQSSGPHPLRRRGAGPGPAGAAQRRDLPVEYHAGMPGLLGCGQRLPSFGGGADAEPGASSANVSPLRRYASTSRACCPAPSLRQHEPICARWRRMTPAVYVRVCDPFAAAAASPALAAAYDELKLSCPLVRRWLWSRRAGLSHS